MSKEGSWRKAFAVVGVFLAASSLCAQPAPEPATEVVPKQLVTSQHFMVVAAHPLAARAGYDAIRQGGSAVDAAIATELVLNLVEPQSSGIGGGGFLLHYAASDAKLEAYDGRETAPASAKPGRFLGADKRPLDWPDAVVSGKSAGVPGLLRLLELAHRRHGKLPWAKLFEPAIKLAWEGFPISPRLNALVAADRFLPLDANARRYFYLPDGKAKPAGTMLKNPEYAAVLKRVAAGGADAFYRGDIARDIAAAVRAAVRRVPSLESMRHASSQLGRFRGAADPGDPRAFRSARAQARFGRGRAPFLRSGAARLRRPQSLYRRPGFRQSPARGPSGIALPRFARETNRPETFHGTSPRRQSRRRRGELRARRSAGAPRD